MTSRQTSTDTPVRRGDRTRTGEAPRAAVPAPRGSGDAGVAEHLAQVDRMLSTCMAELHQLWLELPDDEPDQLDILGENDLPQFIDALLGTGGKRFRPVMSYLGWLSAGGRARGVGAPDVVRVGAALELLHLFALVHDDVMDESASRRGRPTVHVRAGQLHAAALGVGSAARFGDSIAILVGDLAHAEAGHLAADLPAPMRRIWRVLVAELVAGQRRDLVGTSTGRRDLAFARTVARMKSGRYTVERPLELGAAAAGADDAAAAGLARYGHAMGEAFALRDDLLGVWGDPVRTGKPSGDDLTSGKPTVILALAQDLLRGPAARSALERVGSPAFGADDLALLQHHLEVDGVADAVERMISRQVETALTALEEGQLDPDGVAELSRMAHQIAWRDQ